MSKGGRFEKKKETVPRKGWKIALVVLCVVVVLAVGLVACGNHYADKALEEMNYVEVEEPTYTEAAQETESANAEKTAAAEEESTAATEAKVVSNPEDYTNYLIVCKPVQKDGGVKRTETMILCTLNKRTKTLTMTSLLEKAYVQTPEFGTHKAGEATLDTVYALGAANGKGTSSSMGFMNQTLYNNFGIEVDENFEIDLKVFANVVRRLGSVKIELSEEEAKYLSEATNKQIKAGEQSMDGALALEYVQMWSAEDAEGISSLNSQKKLVEAILNKVKTEYIVDLEIIVKEILPTITTSMSAAEMKEFLLTMLPMVSKLTVEKGVTCPVEYQAETVEVNGKEEEVFRFDIAQATKEMRALTKGEA